MQKFKNQFAIVLACLLLAPLAYAHDVTLTPHEAKYRVKISVASGVLHTRVAETSGQFIARSAIEPKGLARLLMKGEIVEQSEFVVTPDGIRPQHFKSVDTISKDQENVSLTFDWSSNSVTGQVGDRTFSQVLEGAVHDRVSIQYELMRQLLNGGTEEKYMMLDGDELKELNVTTIGNEEIKVPFGRFNALGVQHSKTNSSRVTTLWLAPELGYLPLIIEQRRNGKLRVRAELTEYRPLVAQDEPVIATEAAASR